METFSRLLAFCAGNTPFNDEFPSQRPVTRSFDVFYHGCLNKRLSKQSWGWWSEMPSRSLWRHCNVVGLYLVAWPLIGCLSSVSWQRFTKRRYCFHSPDLTILWMIMMFSEGHSSVVTYAMPNKKRMLISGCQICAWQLLSIDINDSVWTPKLSLSLTLPNSSRKRLIMLSLDSCHVKKKRLTHWGRDKTDAISQTTFSNAFSSMKMFDFRLKFHWILFLRV